jgi:hypothetical protein
VRHRRRGSFILLNRAEDEQVAGRDGRLRRSFRSLTGAERARLGGIAAVILALNLLGWGIFTLAILPRHFR